MYARAGVLYEEKQVMEKLAKLDVTEEKTLWPLFLEINDPNP